MESSRAGSEDENRHIENEVGLPSSRGCLLTGTCLLTGARLITGACLLTGAVY